MAKQKETKALVRMVVPLSIKADSIDNSSHTFEGFASTWQQDLGNDIIHKGAFKDTLKAWKASDEAIPLLDSHNQFSIMAAFGQLLNAKETDKGLWTQWEVIDGPEGDAVMKRLQPTKLAKRPIVGKMSIGFFPEEFSFEQPKDTTSFWERIRHITKADLKEVSLVLFPMNPGAAVDASTVKSFLINVENTNARLVDQLTKKQLRLLAGRIGELLKKQKDDDEDEDALRTIPPTPIPDLEDIDDELPADVDGEPDDPADDPSDDELSDVTSTDKSAKEPIAEIPVYQFPDALLQRIQKLNLSQRLSDLKKSSE